MTASFKSGKMALSGAMHVSQSRVPGIPIQVVVTTGAQYVTSTCANEHAPAQSTCPVGCTHRPAHGVNEGMIFGICNMIQ